MSRYVDADGVYQETLKYSNRFRKSVFKIVNALPTADVVEVRHGHWLYDGFVDNIGEHGAECSICGAESEDNGNYCTWCGAKMDDEIQKEHEEQENE